MLHLVAVMCEKLGPSILKNTPQTLSFIYSTLKRACAILQADEEGLGTAFVTETLTMSLGMLSAVLGGAVEVILCHTCRDFMRNCPMFGLGEIDSASFNLDEYSFIQYFC